jgi:hypothetical protein
MSGPSRQTNCTYFLAESKPAAMIAQSLSEALPCFRHRRAHEALLGRWRIRVGFNRMLFGFKFSLVIRGGFHVFVHEQREPNRPVDGYRARSHSSAEQFVHGFGIAGDQRQEDSRTFRPMGYCKPDEFRSRQEPAVPRGS